MKKFVVAGLIGLTALSGLGPLANAMPLSGLVARAAGAGQGNLPLVKVQAVDVGRIGQLEEEIRSLNGRIEEMSFQLLQMQEQIRKFQEDNEFRFQDLENNGSSKKSGALETPRTTDQASVTPEVTDSPTTAVPESGDMAAADPAVPGAAPPPATLGQILFDENGNPIGATAQAEPGANATLPGVETGVADQGDSGFDGNAAGGQQTASLSNPGDLYQSAYGHVLSGDYGLAEQEFRDYLEAFPEGDKAADASFWMGEAQYSQGKYGDSAKTFLNAHQTYGKSPKAPEMLLKLGMSLGALDNKETACATLREVTKRYPQASAAVKSKVASEQSRFGC